jgi:Zn-dependent protease
MPAQKGSILLFRVAGIDVSLHYSWFIVAFIELQYRKGEYDFPLWNVLEYLALFAIILTHEFGHALACRQVGGRADRIVLWPLGGIAYVDPPQRPGAVLWSIAAGPLVNVALVPITFTAYWIVRSKGWEWSMHDIYYFVRNVTIMNAGLLIFNIMPIFPLDGGQILRSLLWFVMGRARSLQVAAGVGFFGVAALVVLAVFQRSIWMGLIAAYAFNSCRNGWLQAKSLMKIAALPRREGYACPSCHSAPPIGEIWSCAKCNSAFDTFLTHATCPSCGEHFTATQCLNCGKASPIEEWEHKNH